MNKSSSMKIAFLVGFDRSGSSMIAKLLARHPDINLIFHPFNSTEITTRQWEIWPPSRRAEKTESFLSGLLDGRIDKSYIASNWFYNHSSSHEIQPDKINLIKDTKFHFKTGWLKANFPRFDLYGIWRDPRAITCSLMRNNFNQTWYGKVSPEMIADIIKNCPELEEYGKFLKKDLSELERMALLIAIRTHIMMLEVPKDHWLFYEQVLDAPNQTLNEFTSRYQLPPFDFKSYINVDYNVSGKKFQSPDLWREFFSPDEIQRLNQIFESINTILETGG